MKLLYPFLSLLCLTQGQKVTKMLSVGDWGGYNLGGQYRENVEAVSFAMYNDYQDNLFNNTPYQAVLNTGDNFYYCGIQNLHDENISNDYVEHFSKIHLQWINSLGNHDYGYNVSAQLDLSQRIYNWVMPQRYYKHKINNVNIYVLDTSPCIQDYINNDSTKWDPCSPLFPPCAPYKNYEPCRFHQNILEQSCESQLEWFKDDLVQNLYTMKAKGEWVVVMGHHMINQLNNPGFKIIVDQYADLYINGHNHILGSYKLYETEKYVTTGAGSMVSEESEVRDEDVYTWYEKKSGYTRHSFTGNYVVTEFVDTTGTVIHTQETYYNDLGLSNEFLYYASTDFATEFLMYDNYDLGDNMVFYGDIVDDYYEQTEQKSHYKYSYTDDMNTSDFLNFVHLLQDSISTDCSSAKTLAQNIKVTMTPENPVSNQVVTMTVDYDLSQEVTDGQIYYSASLNGFPVINSKDDLCKTLKDGDDPCPLEVGHHTTKSTVTMPNISGSLDSTMTWYSGQDKTDEIFCIHIQIDL